MGTRALCHAGELVLMPEEIFSEKNLLANDGTIAKELFYNIVCQTCLLAGSAVVDTNNCYD
jgi:hypothetical protein